MTDEKYELNLDKVSSNSQITDILNMTSNKISQNMNDCLNEVREISQLDVIEETGVRCMLIKTQIKALEIALRPFLENPVDVVEELMSLCKIEEKPLDG